MYTLEDIENYMLNNGDMFAYRMMNMYDIFVDYCKPITFEQHEKISLDVLEIFDAI